MTNKNNQIEKFNELLLNTDLKEADFAVCTNKKCIFDLMLNKKSKEFVDLLLCVFPQWHNIIGTKQHETHHFTLDVHTFAVIKALHSDKDFSQLNRSEKLILLYTALLHDTAKAENIVDFAHPKKGAVLADKIISEHCLNLSERKTVLELIENHQIVGWLASDRITIEEIKAKNLTNPKNFFRLLKIFTLADIKSVQRNEGFFKPEIAQSIDDAQQLICKEMFLDIPTSDKSSK